MSSIAEQYARAIAELAAKPGADPAAISKKLNEHLSKTGRMKLAPRIVAELARLRERSKATAPTLEVASESEIEAAKADAAALGITAEPVVVPSLIRGWRISGNSQLTDRSAKRALVDLYRSITSRT